MTSINGKGNPPPPGTLPKTETASPNPRRNVGQVLNERQEAAAVPTDNLISEKLSEEPKRLATRTQSQPVVSVLQRPGLADATRRHSEMSPNPGLPNPGLPKIQVREELNEKQLNEKQLATAGISWVRSFEEFDRDMPNFTDAQRETAKQLLEIAKHDARGEGLKVAYWELPGKGEEGQLIVAHGPSVVGMAEPPEHADLVGDAAKTLGCSRKREVKMFAFAVLRKVPGINFGGTRLRVVTDKDGEMSAEVCPSLGYGNECSSETFNRVARFYGNVLRAAGITSLEIKAVPVESRPAQPDFAKLVQAYVPVAATKGPEPTQ